MRALEGTHWTFVSLAGVPVRTGSPEREPHIELDGATGRVAGSTGCNRLMGGYTRSGIELRLTGLATTRMACLDDSMQQEQALLRALERVTRYGITGNRLVLYAGERPVAELAAQVPR